MPSAVRLREDYSAEALRALARRSRDANQSRRLLSLAAVRDGMDRGSAAKIGGMDWQTLRDWVHRFNGSGREGLVDNWTGGPQASPFGRSNSIAQFAQICRGNPDREKDEGRALALLDSRQRRRREVRRLDLHPRYVGKLLKKSPASPTSVRGPVIQLKTSDRRGFQKRIPSSRLQGGLSRLAAEIQSAST